MSCPLLLSDSYNSVCLGVVSRSPGGGWIVSTHVGCVDFKLSFRHDDALFDDGTIFVEPVFTLVCVLVFPVCDWCVEHIVVAYKDVWLMCIEGLNLDE